MDPLEEGRGPGGDSIFFLAEVSEPPDEGRVEGGDWDFPPVGVLEPTVLEPGVDILANQ
jgi:hypothetical protein